jgi:peptidoglycan/LPS O-acetylase OafA/YrhL
MGFLRLFLAVSVMVGHVFHELKGESWVGFESLPFLVRGGHAVFTFFIVSGFYITYIWNEQYSKLDHGIRRFYLNRVLRLYPIHLLILLLYVTLYAHSGSPNIYLGGFSDNSVAWYYALLTNITIIGVDVFALLGGDYWSYVIGPTWSLSLEIYFYLLAPFFVARGLRFMLFLFLGTALIRILVLSSSLETFPWHYVFFPSIFMFFVMGGLSYHLYRWVSSSALPLYTRIAFPIALVLYAVTVQVWQHEAIDSFASWGFYLLVAINIPFLFSLTKDNRVDAFVGQLSYPVYLSHLLVTVAAGWIPTLGIPDVGVRIVVVTLLFSMLLHLLLEKPIESLRRHIKKARR